MEDLSSLRTKARHLPDVFISPVFNNITAQEQFGRLYSIELLCFSWSGRVPIRDECQPSQSTTVEFGRTLTLYIERSALLARVSSCLRDGTQTKGGSRSDEIRNSCATRGLNAHKRLTPTTTPCPSSIVCHMQPRNTRSKHNKTKLSTINTCIAVNTSTGYGVRKKLSQQCHRVRIVRLKDEASKP